jgi:ABC-type multidrug transport system fused ATPase/permease subunit
MKNLPNWSNSSNSSSTSIKKAWGLIPKRNKPQILVLAIIQALVSLFDVIGVAFTGLLGVVSVNALQGGKPSNTVLKALDYLRLENLPMNSQIQILSGVTITILLGKTLASIQLAKATTRLLSNLSATTSSRILQDFFALPFSEVRKLTQQEVIFATTRGVNTVILGVIGSAVGLSVDAVLVIALSVILIAISPLSGIVFILLFLIIWQVLRHKLHDNTARLSIAETEISIRTFNLISNTLDSFRELFVLHRLERIALRLGAQRDELARVTAVTSFNPQYAKYVFEFGIVAVTFAITAIQLWQYDASRAIGTITLFVAAGARISPALLRMQQNFLTLTSSAGVSMPTFELSNKLNKHTLTISSLEPQKQSHKDFIPRVELSNLRFAYDNNIPIIKDLNLNIEVGEFFAIAGPSGSGKSTLIDLCLGLLTPIFGDVSVSGFPPAQSIQQWPGKIAYVPQRVHLANNTLRENIVFGAEQKEGVDERCMAVLQEVGLAEEFERMNLTLDTHIGSDQNAFSGGQVQRIGIARALFSSPELLVLDEATSSLDAETESQISKMISNLPKRITRVVIAHRLSTIQAADRVLYLGPTGDYSVGTFQQLRAIVPDFDNQARLMGL